MLLHTRANAAGLETVAAGARDAGATVATRLGDLCDAGVAAGELVKHAQGAEKLLVSKVDVFDVYQGPGVAEGKKSVAFEVTIQPREALKDDQIQAIMDRIIASVQKGTGGVLRG